MKKFTTFILLFSLMLHLKPNASAAGYAGAGIYDDTDPAWVFTGSWSLFNHPSPFGGTIHYTSSPGASASFSFYGTQFSLVYSGYLNRGSADIHVDGAPVATLNQYAPEFAWQSQYVSPVFFQGNHTVTMQYIGGGTYIDVDAIKIIDTAAFVEVPQQYAGNLHLFVLAGQSNMTGQNPPPLYQEVSLSVFSLGKDYRWRTGREPLDIEYGVIDPGMVSASSGYSPGTSFALRMQQLRSDYPIGLIPCAVGASAIEQWHRNLSDFSIYGSCLKRIRASSTMGTVEGIIFWQGETDALAAYNGVTLHHDDWDMVFEDIVASFRNDIGDLDLPVVFVQIGDLPPAEFAHVASIQQAQARVNMPNVVMVSAVGQPTGPDGVHVINEGQDYIGGTLIANEMNNILP